MSQDLKDFIYINQWIGSKVPIWIQGPGGNISFKKGNKIWIKSSGKRLDAMTENSGWIEVDKLKFQSVLNKLLSQNNSEELYAQLLKEHSVGDQRPSMEMAFHIWLPQPWVMHFHALSALCMYECFKHDPTGVNNFLHKNFPQLKIGFVPFHNPGLELAHKLKDFNNKDIIIMQNHGVIVQSELCESVNLFAKVEAAFVHNYLPFETHKLFSLSISEIFRKFQNDISKIEIYFPDTAVYFKRIQKILIAESFGFKLMPDAYEKDKNACEIWLATRMLKAIIPHLTEITVDAAAEIANLPTEEFRRQSS